MKLFFKAKDGGPESSVTGYWLIEWKRFFSIALLRFDGASREAYHTHAFNSISWVLKGEGLFETGRYDPQPKSRAVGWLAHYYPSIWPVITKRTTFHKVSSIGRTWVLTFRGPWVERWEEFIPATGATYQLTSGRKRIDAEV